MGIGCLARLAFWAFALNFAWEMVQAPLFIGMREMPPWDATKRCLQAAVGDAAMILVAFGSIAFATREFGWMRRARPFEVAGFIVLAAAQAMLLEVLSLQAGRWRYGPEMPVEPVFGLGLAPILQWLVVPSAIASAVNRGARENPSGPKLPRPPRME